MGKYSSFKDKLTRFTVEDEYQDKVNARKKEILNQLEKEDKALSLTQFGSVLVKAKLEKARLEVLVKNENLTIAAMDQVLVEQLEDAAYSNLKFDNGVTLSIKDDVYSKVFDKRVFHNWIAETNNEDLLSVNYQTMNSLVKNNLINSEPIPPGIATYFKQSIGIRGLKGLNDEE